MRQLRLIVAAGVASLGIFLVVLLPAPIALRVLGVPPNIATGVSGTVWNGAVQGLSLGGLALGPVRWHAKPARLLLGQLAAGVEATLPDGFLNATVALSPGKRIAVSDLDAAAPLSWLAPSLGRPGSQLTARFERLVVKAGRVESATGNLQVAGVVLPIPTSGPQLAPAAYQVTFAADGLKADEPLTGDVKDSGGPLEIAGKVKITPPRSYELNGTAKPRPDAPPEVQNALQMLGPATPDGGHTLSIAGSF